MRRKYYVEEIKREKKNRFLRSVLIVTARLFKTVVFIDITVCIVLPRITLKPLVWPVTEKLFVCRYVLEVWYDKSKIIYDCRNYIEN